MMHNLSLRHLRAFVQIAQKGSFIKAAEKLCVTQSAMTATIKQLEDSLGLKLFDRTTRKVTLTKEGEIFFPTAEQLLSEFDNSILDMRSRAKCLKGHVSIAIAPAPLANIMPSIIKKFTELYPGIGLTLRAQNSYEVETLVNNKKVDFGLQGKYSEHQSLEYHPVYSDYYGIVSSREQWKNETCTKGTATDTSWKEIDDKEVLRLTNDTAVQTQLDSLGLLQMSPDKRRIECSSPRVLIKLVEQKIGVGILPLLSVSGHLNEDVHFRRLINPTITHDYFLIKHKDRTLSPAASCLYDMTLETFEALS